MDPPALTLTRFVSFELHPQQISTDRGREAGQRRVSIREGGCRDPQGKEDQHPRTQIAGGKEGQNIISSLGECQSMSFSIVEE